MVSIVKSEWHQVEKRYGIEIDSDILSEIYPELDEDEIDAKLAELESGDLDIEEVINDAYENNVDIDWNYLDDDDWWTDRKGGYDVTYNVEEWEIREDYVPPVTHKCTNCKWSGTEYQAEWRWLDSDGNDLDEATKVCPMCENSIELTEVGVEEEKKAAAMLAKWENKDDPEDEMDIEQALEELKAEFDLLMQTEETPVEDDDKPTK